MTTIAESAPAMSAKEDTSCSLRAIAAMASSSPAVQRVVWADRESSDRTIQAARESTEARPGWRDHSHYVAWTELFVNTAHEAAKLLLAARDLVVITDSGVSQAFWKDDADNFEQENGYPARPDWLEFVGLAVPASCEFKPGAPETEALCAALIDAGSKVIDT